MKGSKYELKSAFVSSIPPELLFRQGFQTYIHTSGGYGTRMLDILPVLIKRMLCNYGLYNVVNSKIL